MTIEEKQLQLLNRHYTNIEVYKALRFTIPTTICTLLLGIVAILVTSLDKLNKVDYKFSVCLILIFISTFGAIALAFIHRQYNAISQYIYYLYDKLEIKGSNFYPKGKDHNSNRMRNAKSIFWLGYCSIILLAVISIFIVKLI